MRAGAAAVAFALLVAGCGSDALSTRDLRDRATKICAEALHQTGAIPIPQSPAGGAAFLEAGIGPLRAELSSLASLHASAGAAQAYSNAVQSLRGELDALRAAARTLRSGSDPVIGIKTLQQQLAPLQQAQNAAWSALDIPGCQSR